MPPPIPAPAAGKVRRRWSARQLPRWPSRLRRRLAPGLARRWHRMAPGLSRAVCRVAPVAPRLAHRLAPMPGRMLHKMSEDRIFGMSAEAGFWGLVSLPSLMLAVFGALGYFGGAIGHSALVHVHDDVLRGARDLLTPSTVNSDVAPLVAQILGRGHAGVVSISFVISLWSGSSATSAYLNTITVVYGLRGRRSAVRSRVVALGLYLLAVLAGIMILPALVLGPEAIGDLAPASARASVSDVVNAAYWPVLIVASVIALTTLYSLCLPERIHPRSHLPGALLAMLIWLGGSIGLRAYVADKLRTNAFYGALGAPLAALLFFYITALAVLLGAELNAALRSELHPVTLHAAGSHHPLPAAARRRGRRSGDGEPARRRWGRPRPSTASGVAPTGTGPVGMAPGDDPVVYGPLRPRRAVSPPGPAPLPPPAVPAARSPFRPPEADQ